MLPNTILHLFINLKIFLFCTSCTIKYGLRERKIYYPIRPYINCAEQALIKIPRAISVCKIFETQHVILGVAIVVRNKKIVFVIKDFLRWELFYEYMYGSEFCLPKQQRLVDPREVSTEF